MRAQEARQEEAKDLDERTMQVEAQGGHEGEVKGGKKKK